jgi:hypothetical protein
MNEIQRLRQNYIDTIKKSGERAGGIENLSLLLGYSKYYLSRTLLPRAVSGGVSTDALWKIVEKLIENGL